MGPSETSLPLVSFAPSPAPPYQHCQLEGDTNRNEIVGFFSWFKLYWRYIDTHQKNILQKQAPNWLKTTKINLNDHTDGIFQGFKCDLLCWCPLKNSTRKNVVQCSTKLKYLDKVYVEMFFICDRYNHYKEKVWLYLLFFWTVSGLHLHLQRDSLPNTLPLGQTVFIWGESADIVLF